MKLYKLFLRILNIVNKGEKETRDFIRYLLSLNVDDEMRKEIMKMIIRIAIIMKEKRDVNLMYTIVENAFKGFDTEKIKKFVLILNKNFTKKVLKEMLKEIS